MKITLPELSLVLLIGASSSGKSTFARKHFLPTEVLSSDACRALVSDDENSLDATGDAFEILHAIAAKRLARGRLTVIDATNVQAESRKSLLELARQYQCLSVAIVFDMPKRVCFERNAARTDRQIPAHAIVQQLSQLRRSRGDIKREFRYVYPLVSVEEVDQAIIERVPLWTNKRHEHGPFDIIGDVHGCFEELEELLTLLGYNIARLESENGQSSFSIEPSPGRKAIFLGDLVDRGPDSSSVLRLAMSMVEAGHAFCVPGNHDDKLRRVLEGRNLKIGYGLELTLAQLENETPQFRDRVRAFIDGLVSHFVLDEGRLVVAHAGMKAEMQGRASRAVREFALYGDTTGETDELGLPVRLNWAADYRGHAMVVYGHTPVLEAEWLNRTINIDTGCVFGGKLTALRYPEKELVSVAARRVYFEPPRPLQPAPSDATIDDMLDIADVSGKRIVATRLYHNVTIRDENATAALEAMSRFAIDPRWLVYLPPTMSPTETASETGLLEHPREAYDYFRKEGVMKLIAEEKHMGSRAVLVVCRDPSVSERRFGVFGDRIGGVCYTRTGRRFFNDDALEAEFIARIREAMSAADFWNRMQTDWAVLDCELMPWSAKAQELLRLQYAAVGASSRAAFSAELRALETAKANGAPADEMIERLAARAPLAEAYTAAYRRYCWTVNSIDDLRLAPFHLLATEGAVHANKPHDWHMAELAALASHSPLLVATPHRVLDLDDPASESAATAWWEDLTAAGGEGMVVKPLEFVAQGRRGIVQPAIKCRGREYLRIIYGPEYTLPENLERLRRRSVGAKRSLALREFALGIEALERFTARESLRRVHECVFGVLALESEPIDPRL